VREKPAERLSNMQIRAWMDQVLFSERFFTNERELTTLDKAIAFGIARYVNREAGATYVDPLTIAKALGVKHQTVKASIRKLAKAGRLTVLYKEGRITPILIPVLKPNANALHSTRGDKAFYAARAKLMWRMLGDRRMTIAHRVAAIGTLSQVDPETGETAASQSWLSQIVDVSRPTMRAATANLDDLGYITRLANGVGEAQALLFAGIPGKVPGKVPGKSMNEKPVKSRLLSLT
jgi:Mn-dependent DtxR family transcriptional regulator